MTVSFTTAASTLAALVFTVSFASAPRVAGAATASADCSGAGATMRAMHVKSMPAAGTSVDKTFAAMMLAHEQMMAAASKLELACGTDAKAKAAAKKFIDDQAAYDENLQIILHTP